MYHSQILANKSSDMHLTYSTLQVSYGFFA